MMLSLVVAYHLLEMILIGSCRKLVKLLNYVIIVNVIIWLTGSSMPNLKSLFVYSQTWSERTRLTRTASYNKHDFSILKSMFRS